MMLDTRLTELVAIGASVAANCVACLEHHVGKAREAGIGAEEIAAAREVGRKVRAGAAETFDRTAAGSGLASPGVRTSRGCCS